MGRNFPSFRGWLEILEEDIEKVKKVVKDQKIAKALDEIIEYLYREAGAITISRNHLATMLILLIAKLMADTNDGRNNNRC